MLKPVKLPEGWRGLETLTLTQKLGKTFLEALFESLPVNFKTENLLYLCFISTHVFYRDPDPAFSIKKITVCNRTGNFFFENERLG